MLIFVSAGSDWYREGHFRLDGLYLYQCLICNISQLWALYCLVLFYFATKEELSPWRPHGKFLSVKSVVFFTWWQSVLINALAKPAWTSDGQWTSQQVSKGVQVRSSVSLSVIDSQRLTDVILSHCWMVVVPIPLGLRHLLGDVRRIDCVQLHIHSQRLPQLQ